LTLPIKGNDQATGVEFPAMPMNFDVADNCLGAYQRRRWHFFIAGKADIQPASQRSYGWFDGQSTQADLCPVQV
jgi:hypothetical protein